jgi:hypothetical protein
MTRPDPPEWLWKLDRSELADFLSDPRAAIEQLEGVRAHLDSWWSELPEDTRGVFKNSTNTAGTVPGVYREDVAALGPMGEVESKDLRQPFKLPVVVLAYLKAIESG